MRTGAFGSLALLLCVGLLPLAGFAADRVSIRSGEHQDFSRIVFEWPATVGYQVTSENGRGQIRFERAGTFDLAALKSKNLSRLRNLVVSEDGQSLSFELPPGVVPRHYRSGGRIVLDARGEAKPVEAKPAAVKPVAVKAEDKPAGEKPASDKPAGDKPAGASKGPAITMQYEPIFNGLRLTYELRDPQPAAVFLRAGQLWVIFEGYRPVDQASLKGSLGDRIKLAEQLPHPLATVLRYRVGAGQFVAAHRRDANWIVELKDNRVTPQIPIDVGQQQAGKGLRVFMPIEDVGPRLDLNDPTVGDQLVVMPVLGPGRGIAEERTFAQFHILPSAQGIVIEQQADDLEIVRYRNGVAVGATGGLALSAGVVPAIMPQGVVEAEEERPQRLVDFAAWRRGGPADYDNVRLGLLQRLANAKGANKNSVRWDLARFYLGFSQPERAIGALDVMASSDKGLLDNPEFRAVRGIANLMLRRFEAGRNDLSHKGLDSEIDAYLWRAVAADGMGDWQGALENYKRGADGLIEYEEADRARLKLAAVHAADALGDGVFMAGEVKTLTGYLLPPHLTAEVEYYRGKALERAGDGASAKDVYKKVMASGERESAARASFALAELELRNKTLAPKDVIDRLERLRFAWRGDQLELDLLDRLGQLYVEMGDYRTGLRTLRQAATHFDNSPRTRAITERMSDAFRRLFLDGLVDSMTPVDALSLYYDFRELTPLGADGDNMIRRLADRLVAVDLLDRAAELLEHQVRYRLEGVAQATVAGRLAMIYLLDHKPEKALGVIRATRQAAMPADVDLQRRHLEARALIDTKRFEEAEVLLERDSSKDAELLRADLYWGGSRWAEVVRNGERILGERWVDKRPLSNDERRQVLRIAVALSLDENVEGLRELRSRYNTPMADGAYAGAFDVITAKQDPSTKEIKALTESIASVNTLESFMAAYRKEFDRKGA
ncbi:hypothetical protein [Govanella unica]|uniref:Tetratricopeptide repeat protein n=1 Tax=Govanella unica TaxID=2975056 RepID=A0A9X3TWV7_9PROT|nr:hypothetical protein [Govania unica]MDA5193226.1 hypothetical protein [Govania unica]